MNRDKLNEAADAAFLENYFPSATESPDPRWDMFADGFKQGAGWLMQQPLSERLTEKEKEKIIKFRKEAEELEIYGATFSDRMAGRNYCLILEAFFGADLFKEQ